MNKRDVLIREFKRGKVSRRDFNAALMSMGLSAVAASALMERTMREVRASEPKRGGTLRVAAASSQAGDTLDPAKVTTDIDTMRSGLLYNRLIDFLPDRGLVGNLATSWESNGDATEWSIALVDGVEFHNGKTMTAADVAYSFNRHLDPANASPANAYLGDVESIAADGDRVVVIKMKAPNADIPYLLSEYHFTVQPEGADTASYQTGNAVGTGPWMVKEFEPGLNALFVRHPNYHRSGQPYIDEVETFGVPLGVSRVNALLAGDVDIILLLEAQLVQQVQNSGKAKVLNQPGSSHPTYPMHAQLAPYTDNNVRLALKHAVDRERMLKLAWDDLGTVGRDHPIPQFDPFFAADVEALPRDPDKVKYYLKQAGMENYAFELTASDANFGGANASVVMAELMNEAGVNVTVKKVPADGYWSAVWMQAPWCGSSWYGRPTADLILSAAYTTGAAWNESHWSNERFDGLLLQARKELDVNLRKEMYREIQLLMRDNGATVIPVFTNWVDAYSNKVQNLKGHPYGMAGSFYWDDIWLDDSAG
jgi:peptide/nickel transport system substrate-binding protein